MRYVLTAAMMLGLIWMPMGSAWAEVTYQLKVQGLACPFCAYGIEKKLTQVQHVTSVDIHISQGIAKVNAEKCLNPKSLRQAIREAGFTPESIEIPKQC